MIDCDFIPPQYHEKCATRRTIRRRAACGGGMLAAMVLWIVAHQHQLSSAEAMLVEVSSQKSQLSDIGTRKAELIRDRDRLVEHEQTVGQLSDRASMVIVLSLLSRSLPETVVLTELILDASFLEPYLVPASDSSAAGSTRVEAIKPAAPNNAAAPAEPIRPERLRLAGVAVEQADVFEFSTALEHSGLFDKVKLELVESTTWNGRQAHRFELSCEMIPQTRSRP